MQKWPFFQTLFFSQYRQGKCLSRYSITKKSLSRLWKQEVQKVGKKWHFFKRVNSWFRSKNGLFFLTFLFRQYRPEKCLFQYSRTKKRLSRLKKKDVEKLEKLTLFQKGLTHCFGPKMALFFLTFFFRQYRPRKRLSRYFRTKKRLFRLWKQEVQRVEKLTFFQRG